MTLSDIERTAELFVAAGRRTIPVPIAEWREMQMARIKDIRITTEPNGKQRVKPVDKTPKPLRGAKKAKANRQEKAWLAASKTTRTDTHGTDAAGRARYARSRRVGK